MKLRMYSLVMYQLSGIQAGIQSMHSIVEYSNMFGKNKDYKDWANQYKTVILLNGGTSNNGDKSYYDVPKFEGSMERSLEFLTGVIGIKCAPFYEPDLNYSMTALSFLVDERVFDCDKYPDFDYFIDDFPYEILTIDNFDEYYSNYIKNKDFGIWVKSIGGEKNVKLRLFLSNFKLAQN